MLIHYIITNYRAVKYIFVININLILNAFLTQKKMNYFIQKKRKQSKEFTIIFIITFLKSII